MDLRHIVACAGVTLACAAAACGERETTTITVDDERAATRDPVPEGTAGAGSLRVADIAANPDEYLGRTLTVEADVERVLGPMAFVLDEDALLEGGIDKDLLVLGPKSARLTGMSDAWLDNTVRVTGRIGEMTAADVERELGWDLDPRIEAELERTRAILIAQSIERLSN